MRRQMLCLTLAFCLLRTSGAFAAVNFTDVNESDYYYKPVVWAVEQEITNGTSATLFSPGATCTKRHILTFLWRKFVKKTGQLPPDYDNSREFDYVREWACSNGLESEGFKESVPCTRQMAVTYFWKLLGCPTADLTSLAQFNDVKRTDSYTKAVAWAVEKGITNGNNGSFNPDVDCSRGNIVTFIYRCFQ